MKPVASLITRNMARLLEWTKPVKGSTVGVAARFVRENPHKVLQISSGIDEPLAGESLKRAVTIFSEKLFEDIDIGSDLISRQIQSGLETWKSQESPTLEEGQDIFDRIATLMRQGVVNPGDDTASGPLIFSNTPLIGSTKGANIHTVARFPTVKIAELIHVGEGIEPTVDLGTAQSPIVTLSDLYNEELCNAMVGALFRLPGTKKYILDWKGSRVPRGAVIGEQQIMWTQNGMVSDHAGQHIGTYVRIKDEEEQIMIVSMFPERRK